MASSNSFDFVVSRDTLISLAHQHIGATGEGETPNSSQISEAANLLNMLVKLRAADGMPLWAMKRGTVLPTTGVSSIQTNSHVVTFYDSTSLASAAAASATSLTISSAGTISNSDQIGIELDNGDVFWTTVASGGGTTAITLATGITSAASAANRVYAYTASADRIQRPLAIVEANMLEVVSNASWSVEIAARSDYYNLGNRTSEGTPNQIYYDISLGATTADPTSANNWYGIIYFYPRFQDGKKVVEFTYQRPFADFDSSTDHPDFPQEFYLPLMLELAALLGPKYGLSIEERSRLFSEAKMYREEALTTVEPEGSFRIVPDYTRFN